MRLQNGHLFESAGKIYVRYCINEGVNGTAERVQRSAFLHAKDADHWFRRYSVKGRKEHGKYTVSPALETLRRDFMSKVNTGSLQRATLNHDRPIVDYWRDRFLPYCEEILPVTGQPRRRRSTLVGYRQVWNQHLESHFGARTLQRYDARQARQFLRALCDKHSKTVIKHVKVVASAIFELAKQDEIVAVNPWHDAPIPEEAVPSDPTQHYTLEEVENLVSALHAHPDCQLMIALCCFLGMRPGEMAALQWEDVDHGMIHVRRAAVRGVVGELKTRESVRDIPLITPVHVPLSLWRGSCPNESGYIFESVFGPRLDYHNVVNRVIIPHVRGGSCIRCEKKLKPSGATWKGLYAGRRGACTAAIEVTGGNYAVAQQLLGHKSMTTTLNVYKKQITPTAFKAGMKMLEAAAQKGAK